MLSVLIDVGRPTLIIRGTTPWERGSWTVQNEGSELRAGRHSLFSPSDYGHNAKWLHAPAALTAPPSWTVTRTSVKINSAGPSLNDMC